jgi:hypothetical protein
VAAGLAGAVAAPAVAYFAPGTASLAAAAGAGAGDGADWSAAALGPTDESPASWAAAKPAGAAKIKAKAVLARMR